MKRLVALTASLLLAAPLLSTFSEAGSAEAATSARPPAIKVLSYNLRGPGAAYKNGDKGYYKWKIRKHKQVRLVRNHEPAIFGVQEASTKQVGEPKVRAKDFLVPRYAKLGYQAYVPKGGSPKIIFWKAERFVQASAGSVKLGAVDGCDQPGRSFAWVVLKESATGQHYFIGNTHFATTPECLTTRIAAAKKVHREIAANNPKNHPVILMGDFNNRQQHCYGTNGSRLSAPIRRLDEPSNAVHRYNLDIAAAKGCGQTMHGNWPNARPATTSSRIDFLFHSKKLAAKDYRVDRTKNLPIKKSGKPNGNYTSPSDHYPIVATFRIS